MNKDTWKDKNKQEALNLMMELSRRIKKGELVVTTCGFWSTGMDGTSILRLDVKDVEFIALSDNAEQF